MNYQPNPGDILLNKYEVISLVGEGAFGCVYRARDTKLNRFVAIKFINPNNQVFDRFMDELDAIKKLDHPNIVRLYDYDILKGGVPCIVMEFVEGRELGDILACEGPFNIQAICEIALQILDALVETHKQGIVHCDIKPENIMITNVGARKNVAKLIDFGVASILAKASENSNRQHMLIGTPQYMAPEQILHQPLGPWTDIYAIGLILIELFTGKFVFDSDDPKEVLRMQLYSPVEIPHALACTELGPIISRAIEKDIRDRYHDTQEFYDDVKDAAVTMQSVIRQHPMTLQSNIPRNRTVQSLFTDIDDFLGQPPHAGQHRAKSMSLDPDVTISSASRKSRPSIEVPLMNSANSVSDTNLKIPVLSQNSIQDDATRNPFNEETLMPYGNETRLSPNNEETRIPIGLEKDQNVNRGQHHYSDTPADEQSFEDQLNNALNNTTGGNASNPPAHMGHSVPDGPEIPSLTAPVGDNHRPSIAVPELTTASTLIAANQLSAQIAANQLSAQTAPQPQLSIPVTMQIDESSLPDVPSHPASSQPREPIPLNDDSSVKQKKSSTGVLAAILIICIIVIAGGGYLYKSGILEQLGIIDGSEPVPAPAAEKSAEPQPKTFIGFSTIRSTAHKMAYEAAISGYLGGFKSTSELRTYTIIGTPTTASIYINSMYTCKKTPCKVNMYGPDRGFEVKIQKSGNSNVLKVPPKHDPTSPVIVVLSN